MGVGEEEERCLYCYYNAFQNMKNKMKRIINLK